MKYAIEIPDELIKYIDGGDVVAYIQNRAIDPLLNQYKSDVTNETLQKYNKSINTKMDAVKAGVAITGETPAETPQSETFPADYNPATATAETPEIVPTDMPKETPVETLTVEPKN